MKKKANRGKFDKILDVCYMGLCLFIKFEMLLYINLQFLLFFISKFNDLKLHLIFILGTNTLYFPFIHHWIKEMVFHHIILANNDVNTNRIPKQKVRDVSTTC